MCGGARRPPRRSAGCAPGGLERASVTAAPTSAGSWPPTASTASTSSCAARSTTRWFWDAVVAFLGIPFATPYDAGARHVGRHRRGPRGSPAARMNLAAELRRPVGGRRRPTRTAIVWEGEDGEVRAPGPTPSCAPQVDGLAALLRARGASATATRSASSCRWSPRRSPRCWRWRSSAPSSCRCSAATAPTAIAARLDDADAKALVTADGILRRGTVVPHDAGRRARPLRRGRARCTRWWSCRGSAPSGSSSSSRARRCCWPRARPAEPADAGRSTASTRCSSPTRRARPAGRRASVHVHGGLAGEGGRGGRVPDRRPAATTRCSGSPTWAGSWARGRSSARWPTAPRSRCTRARPTIPGPTGCGRYLERHRVTILGISPTLIRALMPHGDDAGAGPRPVGAAHPRLDRRAVERGPVALVLRGRRRRALPGHQHLGRHRGRRLLPVAPSRSQPLKPMSLGGPALGMAVDVYDDDGKPVRGAGGRAGVHQPWPGMTRGLFKRPRALPRDVLEPLARRVGARRLGVDRRGRRLVPPRPQRRHHQGGGQAARARPRSSRCSCRTRPSSRPRRSASPTR